jgi:hypothetical protein
VSSRDALGVVGMVVLLAAGGSGRHSMAQEASSRGRVPPAPPDHDLKGIRNIFRYADEAPTDSGLRLYSRQAGNDDAETSAPPSRVRLVGLVERGDGLVAALAVDGEVVLLSEGDSAGDFTVLGVSEEAVTLRTPEGERQTLRLP